MKSYGHKKEISFKTRSRLRTKLVSYYALLYDLPSNPNIKKNCLKNILFCPQILMESTCRRFWLKVPVEGKCCQILKKQMPNYPHISNENRYRKISERFKILFWLFMWFSTLINSFNFCIAGGENVWICSGLLCGLLVTLSHLLSLHISR